ncbi:MAG: putative NBD/HSP70 family sugar kinase [Colwellia sp.]
MHNLVNFIQSVEIASSMPKYLLSIDQGTTSSRAILFTPKGELYASAQEEFPQYFPKDGWVEHQPNDILQTVLFTCQKLLAENQLSASDIIGIGIPTSVKQHSFGINIPDTLFIMPLYGKTEEPATFVIQLIA